MAAGRYQGHARAAVDVLGTATVHNDEAWALLSVLHPAGHGGLPLPDGWVATYDELYSHGFVVFVGNGRYQIPAAGVRALKEHFLKG